MSDEKNRFDLDGTLKRIDTRQANNGKTYYTLIVETGGQYSKTIPVALFGKAAEMVDELSPGDVLSISGRLGGREWQNKCFGENVGLSVDVVSKAQRQQPLPTGAAGTPPEDDDTPF
jgi:single-stranded DNA-binding protein